MEFKENTVFLLNHNTVTVYFLIFIFIKKETKYNYYFVS
ncbi:hypothetical protein B4082_5734 [Bacillus cereus]|uniref:Uncharacterized protein n=1 Tax=Bacillus cereus TaxID=1396 RepID=A0A161QX41_BACCE|nr:hypothetical protein B4082_5734 [Bacillus cereus]